MANCLDCGGAECVCRLEWLNAELTTMLESARTEIGVLEVGSSGSGEARADLEKRLAAEIQFSTRMTVAAVIMGLCLVLTAAFCLRPGSEAVETDVSRADKVKEYLEDLGSRLHAPGENAGLGGAVVTPYGVQVLRLYLKEWPGSIRSDGHYTGSITWDCSEIDSASCNWIQRYIDCDSDCYEEVPDGR